MELKTRKWYQDREFRRERLEHSTVAGISCGATELATRKYRAARQTVNGAESLPDANVCAFAHFPFRPLFHLVPGVSNLGTKQAMRQHGKLLDIAIHGPIL